MENQQVLTLVNLSDQTINYKLKMLDQIYHITEDSIQRHQILLAIDELKIELMKRGKYDQSI